MERREEKARIRYTIDFEKKIPLNLKPDETVDDYIEEIADDIFYNTDDWLDGDVRDVDHIRGI
ncbi:hypothetical protein [Staphylococcus debuckii]|uniref:hypothetical protein n=1 Tax=Staphylococcus debuckii TaxID=2044912 RepID=UPI000F436C06|nr:hypothetical protein [Staphylococcus debuckii]AYU54658.1 hypothetical protein CNQ82_04135 [Staphylococcus debuckii]